MSLKIQSVNDASFKQYGRVIEGFDFSELIDTLEKTTDAPENVIYVPSDEKLEALPIMSELENNVYGGMPIQIGYCNGTNTILNCLEYHRDSEIDIAADDVVLLLGRQQDAADGTYDSSKIEAFLCPKGCGVELYATTLHYAPCSAKKNAAFRVAIVLPRGTNLDKPNITPKCSEDKRLFARNKWLIAHPNAPEAQQGAVVAIVGENTYISPLI